MTTQDIIIQRLVNQQIANSNCQQPQEVVSGLVAMQAQEYAMAKWAIGLRLSTTAAQEAQVEKALQEGAILRTHLMRPTWHFVTPTDIRWLLALTAPRVHAANAYMYRKLELDTAIFKRSNDVLVKTMEGGQQLTCTALQQALQHENIVANGLRLGYLMMYVELEGIVCSGARQGKQFTYALLEERVPAAKPMDREEALALFIRRYFTSRGPATLADFVTWSGLTMKEAKAGLAMVLSHFVQENVDGQTYIFAPITLPDKNNLQTTFLMPDYDEYGMGYKDRSVLSTTAEILPELRAAVSDYDHWLVLDGVIVGTWKRTTKNNKADIETMPFISLNKAQQQAIADAVERYYLFVA